jgi:hypothetical protein
LAVLSKEVRGVEASASEATVSGVFLMIREGAKTLKTYDSVHAIPRYGDLVCVAVDDDGKGDYREVCSVMHEPGPNFVTLQVRPKPDTGTTEDKQSARARADVQERED